MSAIHHPWSGNNCRPLSKDSTSITSPLMLPVSSFSTPMHALNVFNTMKQQCSSSPSSRLSEGTVADDGYASLSSLSTLLSMNQETDDQAFKSTPLRSVNGYPSSQTETKLDSRYGGSSIREMCAPQRHSSFWDSLGRQNQQQQQQSLLESSHFVAVPSQQYCPVSTCVNSISDNNTALLSTLQRIALSKVANRSPLVPTKLGNGTPGSLTSIDLVTRTEAWLQELKYQELVQKLRQEMIGLIDNSMSQLEIFLRTAAVEQINTNRRFEGRADCKPLNLKAAEFTSILQSTPTSSTDITEDSSRRTFIQANTLNQENQHFNAKDNCIGKLRTPQKVDRLHTPKMKIVSGKRRRSRIRAGSRKLRVRQLQVDENAVGSTGSDGTLDLRVRYAGSRELTGSYNEKTMILTASQLKRAKLMFLFARYPNSTTLKSFFPEVTFTRATTAQIVKWFSNFREFFYIQIERWARQCHANGCHMDDAMKITPNHELFKSLEAHYNRDKEVTTPKDFLIVTQVAVREFVEAVVYHKDRDPMWKKNIYKTVAVLDKCFPDFLKFIK